MLQTLRKFGHLLRRRNPVATVRPRPVWVGDKDRFSYQEKFITFDIPDGSVVLDIGGGHYPFPKATILSDRYLETTEHRAKPLIRDDRPFVLLDIHDLPFRDKSIDFIYCSHVLEHVEDPYHACSELMRVGRRGYIETPASAADLLFAWAKGMHKWQVVSINNTLSFFEYTPRQLEGVGSAYWRDKILGNVYDPLQDLFYNNLDMFNVMFEWSESFECVVHRLSHHLGKNIR